MNRQHLNRGVAASAAVSVAMSAALFGAASASAAPVEVGGSGGVPLTLEVEDSGELTMTVDSSTAVVLTENGSTDDLRRFEAQLPEVTVTDTRTDVPEGVWWAVVGQTSDFVNTQDPAVAIPGEYLGWTPKVLDVPADDDTVFEGGSVESTAEGGSGLATGEDLLFATWESVQSVEYGTQWTAGADLALVAPADEVESGSYTATLTLSLFEDEI